MLSDLDNASVGEATNLSALFLARAMSDQVGFTFVDHQGATQSVSFAAMFQRALALSQRLQTSDVSKGDRVLFQLLSCEEVITSFWACIIAQVVPVVLNPAPSYRAENHQLEKVRAVIEHLSITTVLCSPSLQGDISRAVDGTSAAQILIADCVNLPSDGMALPSTLPECGHDDVAAIFLTSGSTGVPKAVPQTHRAMMAMAAGTIAMNGFTAEHATLNWMSMDHAGALVFLGVMPMILGARQIHAPIEYVLKSPLRWLDLIDKERAAISWAPNFVFSLMLAKAEQIEAGSWDLSSMHFMVNAGEAVVSSTARAFIRLMESKGLPSGALKPAFGMVETCSGITWSTGFTLATTKDTDSFVSLGGVIPGCEIKVVDEVDQPLPEGVEGRLMIKGPSVFTGYLNRPELNADILSDGWFETGDLAMITRNELFVTGRSKEVLIINGNNFYCHDIERVAAELDEVVAESVAAVGVPALKGGTECPLIFYATEVHLNAADREVLEKQLSTHIVASCGVAPGGYIALAADAFPRTAIGKIQRSVLKEGFVKGEYNALLSGLLLSEQEPRSSGDTPVDALVDMRSLADDIKGIWCRVLGVSDLHVDDMFFEVGGSSLAAIQIQSELEALIGRTISMAELFDTPTIRTMAAYFGDAVEPDASPAVNARSARSWGSDIAVIGIGCRFPGANGPAQFWDVLENCRETITRFAAEDAIEAGVAESAAHHPDQVNAAPILEDIEGCDLDFWKFSEREASIIDPQQRVFLETAWEAFEDAGYDPGAHLGRVAVYASAATNTYQQNNLYANSEWVTQHGGALLTVDSYDGFNVMTSNDKDYLPTRVSFKLDLVGPSLAVQTACSSTLVAVHEAVKSLRLGESEMAVAGGCALMLPQHAGHLYMEGMINSPDGHCRAYDAEAQGTIFGSGSGAVILKRLEDAVADGDAVYAVIKGSGVANDGAQKMGYAAPSMAGETRAIREAFSDAGIDPASVGYVEGHGTGTPIGDPIEVQALSNAFSQPIEAVPECALGSVKTNIGHMGIASGIAGFIKTVLALHHKKRPGTVHFKRANPAIDFERTPFYVSSKTEAWRSSTPRRAGVNSLGIGGTNVHVILEEAPSQPDNLPTESPAELPNILPLSAVTPAALQQFCDGMYDFLKRHPDVNLHDVAYTFQQGRRAFSARHALVFRDREELLSTLGQLEVTHAGESVERVVFLFTGQGSQYLDMAKELLATQPIFKEAFLQVAKLFSGQRDIAIETLVMTPHLVPEAEALLNSTQYTQPVLFALQVALTSLYRAAGIEPSAVMGHSVGEIAAVVAAGGLTVEDGAKLVEIRSRLMQGVCRRGAMAAVTAQPLDLTSLLFARGASVELAAVNSATEFTISGSVDAIDAAITLFSEYGLRATRLPVSHAFHSSDFLEIQDEFRQEIKALSFKPVRLSMFNNVNGNDLREAVHDADYWVQQVCSPVLFKEATRHALQAGHRLFVEMGPQPVLCGFGRNTDNTDEATWLASLRKGQSDRMQFYRSLGSLFNSGQAIKWDGLVSQGGRRISALPTYPWQRTRCWVEADGVATATRPMSRGLLEMPINLPGGQRLYAQHYSPAVMTSLNEHRVFGRVVPPAALYVAQSIAAAADYAKQSSVCLEQVHFMAPMVLADRDHREVHLVLQPHNRGASIELYSQPLSGEAEVPEVVHHITAELLSSVPAITAPLKIEDLKKRCHRVSHPSDITAYMAGRGIQLGASFRRLDALWAGRGEALAKLSISSVEQIAEGNTLTAGLIDSHWQTGLAALDVLPDSTMVPAKIERLVFHKVNNQIPQWAYARIRATDATQITMDVALLNAVGERLLDTQGLTLQRVSPELFNRMGQRVMSVRWHAESVRGAEIAVSPDKVLRVLSSSPLNSAQPVVFSDDAVSHIEWVVEGDLLVTGSVLGHVGQHLILSGETQVAELTQSINQTLLSMLEHNDNLATFIILMTRDVTSVSSDEARIAAAAFAIRAQIKSLAKEYPDVVLSTVEIVDQSVITPMMLAPIMARSEAFTLAGEVLSRHSPEAALEVSSETGRPLQFSRDSVQIISGGLGGVGLETARWMVDCGARKLVLFGRAAPDDESTLVINELTKLGATIEVMQADVSRLEDVERVVAQAGQYGELEVIVHAAGAVSDGAAPNLTAGAFATTFDAKVRGAFNLIDATRQSPAELTVFFSSTAAWFGSEGQSNYAAANAALEGLASVIDSPAGRVLSVAWGPWQSTGMTSRLKQEQLAYIEQRGYGFLSAEEAFCQLGPVMAGLLSETTPLGAVLSEEEGGFRPITSIAILKGDADSLSNLSQTSFDSQWSPAVSDTPNTRGASLSDRLRTDQHEAVEAHLQDWLAQQVVELTTLRSIDEVDFDAGFIDLGVDSLAGLELRKRLEKETGLPLKSTLILDYPSVRTMIGALLTLAGDGADDTRNLGEQAQSGESLMEQLAREIGMGDNG